VVPADATIIQHRMPTELFGDGLIDAIPDSAILANAVNQGLGIQGIANMTADANGVLRPGRFGRKAQRPTLIQLVADAFGHDLSITNPLVTTEDLPQGNPIPSVCPTGPLPLNDKGAETIDISDFVEFLAAPVPLPFSANAMAGQETFISIGCAKCHVQSYTTQANFQIPTNFTGGLTTVNALSNQVVSPYSDFLVHDMGPALADQIPMGQATGSQFRTTPLWGLSGRTTYMHDGRATSLAQAIAIHGGEATTVIGNYYTALSSTDQSNLLAFLNSL
jgi:CxxC motif-containing protein (DUF1111 family)